MFVEAYFIMKSKKGIDMWRMYNTALNLLKKEPATRRQVAKTCGVSIWQINRMFYEFRDEGITKKIKQANSREPKYKLVKMP